MLIAAIGPTAYLLARARLPFDQLITGAGARSLRVYTMSTVAAFLFPLLPAAGHWAVNDLVIAVATGLVLAVGLSAAVGRGRPWSF